MLGSRTRRGRRSVDSSRKRLLKFVSRYCLDSVDHSVEGLSSRLATENSSLTQMAAPDSSEERHILSPGEAPGEAGANSPCVSHLQSSISI